MLDMELEWFGPAVLWSLIGVAVFVLCWLVFCLADWLTNDKADWH